MAKYLIYTDSTADLTDELVAKADVKVIPMEFTICDKSYFNYADGRELGFHEFYDMVREGNAAVTSLINVDRYNGIFEPELEAGNDILYIGFSSGLSGSYNCACTAIEELKEKYPERNIKAVDSLAASMGEGLLVYLAANKRDEGMGLDELAAWVAENRNNLCHWFTVDDLNHLKRGGRVSSAAAFFGNMLNIKPVLHVDDEGHLVLVHKARGRKAALEKLVEEMENTAIDPKNQTVFISHADAQDECNEVANMVRSKFGVKEIYTGYIGPVIGAHSGPGTIALFFVGKHK